MSFQYDGPARRRRAGRPVVAGSRLGIVFAIPCLLFITIAPIWTLPILQYPLFGIEAVRPARLVAALMFVSFLLQPETWRVRDRFEAVLLVVLLAYLMIFTLAFFRSVPNLDLFRSIDAIGFPPRTSTYVNSHFVLRLLYVIPLLYAVKRVNNHAELMAMLKAVAIGLFLLSIWILVTVAGDPAALLSHNRLALADLIERAFSMHYNDVASAYVIGGPILLYLALTRGIVWAMIYIISILAVLALESRTALVILACSTVMVLIATQRIRFVQMSLMSVMALIGFMFIGPTLLDQLTQGLYQGGGSSLDMLLNGRLARVWSPLLTEWLAEPSRFWFGSGEYGILTSHNRLIGLTFAVSQAHNAYLEFLLDNGLILGCLFFAGMAVLIRKAWRIGQKINTDVYWVLFICIVSFLVNGLTGRRFFPFPENMLMFPIIGALVCVARMQFAELKLPPAEVR